MVSIDQSCLLEDMRQFLILSCCYSFIPEEYIEDKTVFPERVEGQGLIYTEAEDKVTLAKIGEIQFVKAENAITVTYTSKSGATMLKWDRTEGQKGRLSGKVSTNSIIKLIDAGIITPKTVKKQQKASQKQN